MQREKTMTPLRACRAGAVACLLIAMPLFERCFDRRRSSLVAGYIQPLRSLRQNR